MMIRVFENPVNNRREKVDVDTSVCAFFFGPIYLALKGLWKHVLVWLAIVVPISLAFDNTGLMLSAAFASLIYAVKIQSILVKRYVRRGWTEVTEKISTPYELLQAKLYEDSILSTYTRVNTVQPVPTRACQFCTAEVTINAVKCHFCRSDLSQQMARA